MWAKYGQLGLEGTMGVRASLASESDEIDGNCGNVLVHGLWKRGEQTGLDEQVVDCNAPFRRNYMDSEKILEGCACVKKLKYLRPYIEQRRSFKLRGFVRRRMALSTVRNNSLLLCVSM